MPPFELRRGLVGGRAGCRARDSNQARPDPEAGPPCSRSSGAGEGVRRALKLGLKV